MNKAQYTKFLNSLHARIEILEQHIENTKLLPCQDLVTAYRVRLYEVKGILGNLVDIMGDEL